jgi:uncharacterized protein VirK/YbjX
MTGYDENWKIKYLIESLIAQKKTFDWCEFVLAENITSTVLTVAFRLVLYVHKLYMKYCRTFKTNIEVIQWID